MMSLAPSCTWYGRPKYSGWVLSRFGASVNVLWSAHTFSERWIDTVRDEGVTHAMVVPTNVTLKAPDGVEFHNQLFLPKDIKPGERRPALIFVHGGPRRHRDRRVHVVGAHTTGRR